MLASFTSMQLDSGSPPNLDRSESALDHVPANLLSKNFNVLIKVSSRLDGVVSSREH